MAATGQATGLLPIDNARAAVWMIGSSACFATSYALTKFVAADLPAPEIVFFRCLFGMVVIAPFVMRQGLAVYRTKRPGMHLIRSVCATLSLNLTYYAMVQLPLATAISLSFSRPLWMILIAVTMLGEVVRWRRGLATLIGFGGVLVVAGPSSLASLSGVLAAVAGAAFTSGAVAVVRRQSATDSPSTIMVWFATSTAIITAIPALVLWRTPQSLNAWLLLAVIGVVGTLGQYFMIRAFVHGEATVMNPIDYSQILITALLGYIFFREVPAWTTWAGAAIIVASTLYILLRESRRKIQPVTAAPPSP
jgi:drug/metabolite transporter (DMT)-like permease